MVSPRAGYPTLKDDSLVERGIPGGLLRILGAEERERKQQSKVALAAAPRESGHLSLCFPSSVARTMAPPPPPVSQPMKLKGIKCNMRLGSNLEIKKGWGSISVGQPGTYSVWDLVILQFGQQTAGG